MRGEMTALRRHRRFQSLLLLEQSLFSIGLTFFRKDSHIALLLYNVADHLLLGYLDASLVVLVVNALCRKKRKLAGIEVLVMSNQTRYLSLLNSTLAISSLLQ